MLKMVRAASLFCLALLLTCNDATPDEERLYADLFRDLNKFIKPVANASNPVVVNIGAAIQMIVETDERNQLIVTSMWMRFSWEDVNLRWDPEEYGGTRSLVVPIDHIWRPDIVLYNNADSEFRGMIDTSPHLTHIGVVYWDTPALFKSACRLDVSFFPFDIQRCSLKSYDAAGIDLVHSTASGDLSSFIENGEWDVVEMPIQRISLYYHCCPAPFVDVTFTVVLRRHPHFYLLNLLVPCLLVSFVTALNFLLPADSGEKVGLVLTVLLALTVFLLIVAETTPASDETPIIDFIATIFINSLSVIITVFVLHLHFRLPGVRPVPLWLRKLAFVSLAPWLFVQVSYDRGKPVQPPERNDEPPAALPDKNGKTKKRSWWPAAPAENSTDLTQLAQMVASINSNLNILVTRSHKQDADEDVLTQWKYVAVVFDRFFSWFMSF